MATTTVDVQALRNRVSLEEVVKARHRIASALPRTPLIRHPLLARAAGCELYLKHENHLPTGAFKVRGGENYMALLDTKGRARGVVTATRGNHGQSIALAASRAGVRAVIVVPQGNNAEKNAAIRAYGGEVVEHGKDFDESRAKVDELVASEGLHYIHSANEPNLINGVGTYSLEIYEDLPDVDAVVIPVGGGSAICGAITVFKRLKPSVEIIGVQAANAPCVYESWKQKRLVSTDSANTVADGLATRVPFELPFSILQDGCDDMLLVSEDDIRTAIKMLMETTHNFAEGAGAAATAAILANPERFRGKTVAAVLSGGNVDQTTLRWALG